MRNEIEELKQTVKAARNAAYGDSNDEEIELLQEALSEALAVITSLTGDVFPEGEEPQ